jgi:cytochrome P450
VSVATGAPAHETAAPPRRGLPPGPRAPRVVQMARWARDPIGFLAGCRRRYGDAFAVDFAGFGRWVYFADAETIASIFQADADAVRAGESRDMLEPVVGRQSVLILDGDEHRRQRRLLLPSFQGSHVRRFGDLMREVVEEDLTRWPQGRPFPLRPRTQAITLEVILRAVFGLEAADARAELHGRITRLLDIAGPVLLVPALARDFGGRLTPGGRLWRARRAVDELVYAQIRARRAAGSAGDDVLSLLLGATDEEGRGLDDEAIRDELMTLVLAGHETTATGLAWAFERLVRHPEAMARLREELDAGEEEYLDAVVRETLRVRPVLFDVSRKVVTETEVGGWVLPPGTYVAPALALVHLDPAHHPDPLAFRPERHLDGSAAKRTWIPFGGGPRSCLGAGFALFEMRMVLRTVLAALDLRPARPADEPAKLRNITLVPARGAEVMARPRA